MSDRVIGRQTELAALDAFLTSLSHGFACFALEGEAGIGKTTVWRDAVRRALDKRITVLACRPSQAEARLSFAALGDLLDGVGDDVLARLPGPQRHALEVALLRADSGGPPPGQRAIGVAFLSVLRELGAASEVLLAVDDAQWLDSPSADLLEFVARRLASEPIGVLVALRLDDQQLTTFDRALPESRRQVVRLGNMSLGALHEMLSLRLGHVFPRPTLVKIAEASGGNPFYALEIARELRRVAEPPAGAPLPVPEDLRELVAARVHRLPEQTRDALLAAAASSHPTTALLDTEETVLQPAVQADIVRVRGDGRIVFSHPLYASAVYESTSVARRRALHRQLAEGFEEVDERARHLALATTPPDESVARVLEKGAERARTRGAWRLAAELLEQAQAFTPHDRPEDAYRRGIAAAEHHIHAGDRGRASANLEKIVAEVPAGRLRADALRLLGEIRYNDESFREAVRCFEEARQHATDARLIAEIELDLAYAASQASPSKAAAIHVQQALELTATLGDRGLHAQALAFRAMAEYLFGQGIDWDTVAQSLALEDPERVMPLQRTPSGVSGMLLLFAGRLTEARERLTAVRQRAIDRGDESDLAFFVGWLAWLETQAGDLAAAQAYADEAELVATLTGGRSMLTFAAAMTALLSAHRGEIDRARRKCDEATLLAKQTGYAVASSWIVAARCLAELSVDNVVESWQAAEPLARYWEAHRISEPVGLSFLPDALEALITLGELDRATTLLDPFHLCAEELDRVWGLATGERCRGLLLAARGDLSGALEHFDRALTHHARLEMPFELARTLLCLGRVQRRRKLRKEARQALGQALEIFDRLGTPVWAAKARAELERTHVRQSPAGLTPSECRVAELAASGLTNKTIAERLFMSPKTVEANLARIYTKLNITSRAELGAKMTVERTTLSPNTGITPHLLQWVQPATGVAQPKAGTAAIQPPPAAPASETGEPPPMPVDRSTVGWASGSPSKGPGATGTAATCAET